MCLNRETVPKWEKLNTICNYLQQLNDRLTGDSCLCYYCKNFDPRGLSAPARRLYCRFSAIVFYLPSDHCSSFEKNEIEKFGILIFDVLFIRDLRIIPEGENMSIQCK